jgi:hypothetical protein
VQGGESTHTIRSDLIKNLLSISDLQSHVRAIAAREKGGTDARAEIAKKQPRPARSAAICGDLEQRFRKGFDTGQARQLADHHGVALGTNTQRFAR